MGEKLDFRLKLEIELKNSKEGLVIEDGDYTGLDIDFDIIKSYVNKPQTSTLTIYNLSRFTYNDIYKNANAFRLSCARGDEKNFKTFYVGYPIRATQVSKQTVLTANQGFMAQDANAGRSGQNDLETKITLMSYSYAEIYKSYRENVSTELILKDCIDAYGLPLGNFDEIKHINIRSGFTCRGRVSNVLNWLGDVLGFYWNVNDMKFNLYIKSRDDYKTFGAVLTPENSSVPERLDDEFKAKTATLQKANKSKGVKGIKKIVSSITKKGFVIKTQLLPFLQCGSTVRLKDFDMVDVDGDKYVYKIHHIGNNYGTDAFSEIYFV